MTPLTLTYYPALSFPIQPGAPVVMPLAATGASRPKFYPRSRGIATVAIDYPGADPGAAPVIPFGGYMTLTGTFAGMNGGNPVVIFAGKRTTWSGRANPAGRNAALLFSDALWDAAHTPFQHFWNFTAPGGALTQEFFARINLMQNITDNPNVPWTYFTIQQQLTQIVQFMQNNCGIRIQMGRCDVNQIFNLIGVKSIKCLDAILKCLQGSPDIMTLMDYTTIDGAGAPLPTIHFVSRAAFGTAGAITMPYAGTDAHGRAHKSTGIKDRPDLIPSQCVIQYQTTYQDNGVDTTYSFNDAYPPGSQGTAPLAEVTPIDLTGQILDTQTVTVNAAAFAPATVGFWQNYCPTLKDDTVFQASIGINGTLNINDNSFEGLTVTDEITGQLLTGAQLAQYPNIHLPDGGAVCSWMTLPNTNTPVVARKVIVKGFLNYTSQKSLTQDGNNQVKTDVHTAHPLTARLVLTNSPVGAQPYTIVTRFQQAEIAPTGLAAYFFNSQQQLPWEGEHQIVEGNIYAVITPANLLNLTNTGLTNQQPGNQFNALWATMNAAIVDVEIDFFAGTTAIKFGPHKHNTVSEWFEWVMLWRWREAFNYSTRVNAQTSNGGSVNTSGQLARENTVPGIPQKSLATLLGLPDVNGNSVSIQHDATQNGGQITISTVDPTGAIVPTAPQLSFKLSDINELVAGQGIILELQRVSYNNASCQPVHRWTLASPEIAGA